jgi:hypothetical protein
MKTSVVGRIAGALIAAILFFAVVYESADANIRNIPYKRLVVGGKPFLQFNAAFQARTTDTMRFNFQIDPALNPCDTTLFVLNVRTAKAHADSNFNMGMRYQYSTDAVTYSAPVTIGTDSTTFAATAGTSFSQVTVRFGQNAYGGWQPYMRLVIVGRGTNSVGGKVAVDVIEQ